MSNSSHYFRPLKKAILERSMPNMSGEDDARQRANDERFVRALERAGVRIVETVANKRGEQEKPPVVGPKPPGRWSEYEDQIVRSGSLSKRSPVEVAKSLNRLETSVVTRAKVIGFPFVGYGDA